MKRNGKYNPAKAYAKWMKLFNKNFIRKKKNKKSKFENELLIQETRRI